MRFLVDESLQQRIAGLLVEQGHDAVYVGDLGLLGASDERVLAAAVHDERTLITADTDFGTLLTLTGSAGPSVILLRRPGRRAHERAEAIMATLMSAQELLEAGAIVVVEPHRLRVRSLPIS